MVYPARAMIREPLVQRDIAPMIVERVSIKTVPVFINEPTIEEASRIRTEPMLYQQKASSEPKRGYVERVRFDASDAAPAIIRKITSTTTTTTKITRSVQSTRSENAGANKVERTITTTTGVIRKQDVKDRSSSGIDKMVTSTIYKTLFQNQQRSKDAPRIIS